MFTSCCPKLTCCLTKVTCCLSKLINQKNPFCIGNFIKKKIKNKYLHKLLLADIIADNILNYELNLLNNNLTMTNINWFSRGLEPKFISMKLFNTIYIYIHIYIYTYFYNDSL